MSYVHYVAPDAKELGLNFLSSKQWPQGLQEQMVKNWDIFPYRFMVLDDSGSMSVVDGTTLMSTGTITKAVTCSRWHEMRATVQFHLDLADTSKAPTEFCFLNAAEPIVVGEGDDDDGMGKTKVNKILNGDPSGGTPLCRVLEAIRVKVKLMEPELRERGQKVAITIFTDGKASDGDLKGVLSAFNHLPVWMVIRLCTNDDDVAEYWADVDDNIELEMDVLDDLRGEALEINRMNKWLTYGQPLHMLRESGCRVKVFDRLDEARLPISDIHAACPLILGGKIEDFTHPDLDMASFKSSIQSALNKTNDVWDPLTKRTKPWIQVNNIGAGGCCTIA